MKVLIIEDENHSAERLQRYIRTLHPDYEISGITKSIVQSIDFLQREQPDLIFSDIRLQDGLSFDIFRQIKIVSPIISPLPMTSMLYRHLNSIVSTIC